MIERIRDLALEASVEYIASPVWAFTDAELEKFAQLVVQECIDIVKPTQHHEAHAQSYLGGVEALELLDQKIQDIRQHFGVPQ
jgi:hypothetical protein